MYTCINEVSSTCKGSVGLLLIHPFLQPVTGSSLLHTVGHNAKFLKYKLLLIKLTASISMGCFVSLNVAHNFHLSWCWLAYQCIHVVVFLLCSVEPTLVIQHIRCHSCLRASINQSIEEKDPINPSKKKTLHQSQQKENITSISAKRKHYINFSKRKTLHQSQQKENII